MGTRRHFLGTGITALAGASLPRPLGAEETAPRHVLFEYYHWYRRDPWVHWEQWGRVPPDDIASRYVPRLGPYDSLDPVVLEQHARWMADCGATGINLTWWGPGSPEDLATPLVMDVMRHHGLKVTFHLEPYETARSSRFAEDVLYLVREYGDRRHWDTMLLLRTAGGRIGPVFKPFFSIVPETVVDCHGVTRRVDGHTPDDVWRRQTDAVRDELRRDFDHVLLYADSLEYRRTPAAGFDGVAIYDPFVEPSSWPALAAAASERGLLSTFAVNPGFDGIEIRDVEPGSCYEPPTFEPAPPRRDVDFSTPAGREDAARLARRRIESSFEAAVAVQTDAASENARRGVFLVYVTSFNEWHEGTSFEPMKDAAALTPGERRYEYHNPEDGSYRLDLLRRLLRG